jgi:hypothetical protein
MLSSCAMKEMRMPFFLVLALAVFALLCTKISCACRSSIQHFCFFIRLDIFFVFDVLPKYFINFWLDMMISLIIFLAIPTID